MIKVRGVHTEEGGRGFRFPQSQSKRANKRSLNYVIHKKKGV